MASELRAEIPSKSRDLKPKSGLSGLAVGIPTPRSLRIASNGPSKYRMKTLDFADHFALPVEPTREQGSVVVFVHLNMEGSAVRQIPTGVRTRLVPDDGSIAQGEAPTHKILQE